MNESMQMLLVWMARAKENDMSRNSVKEPFGRVWRGLEEELDLGEDTMGQSKRAKGYLQAARRELRAGGKKVRTLDVEALEDLVTRVLQVEGKWSLKGRPWLSCFVAAFSVAIALGTS
jgi:hypothetical protein